jgi:phosphoribosyl-ATP pyrophosphohydrolase
MADTLTHLEAIIAGRRTADPASSYVAQLFAKGTPKIAQKLGEEAVETVIAALGGDKPAIAGEAADLLFHLLVLLEATGVPLASVFAELDRREGTSGIAEKAARVRPPRSKPAPLLSPVLEPEAPAEPALAFGRSAAARPLIRKG